MIRLEASHPPSWLADLTAREDLEPLEPALQELVHNDTWIDDFIERLNGAINDIVQKKP